MNALTAAIVAYVLVQLAVGVFASRRVDTEEDYLLAGRRLGPWVAGFSVFATWFGAEACVGAAGQVYAEGLGRLSVEPFAYGLALIVTGVLVAAPLWRAGVTTFPDLLRKRYSPAVERATALLHIPGTVLWAAAQVRAFGQVLSSAGGVDLDVAITIAAVIAVAYTVMGGLLADVVTDVMQGGVLVLGLVVIAVALVVDVGGISNAIELAAARPSAPHSAGPLEVFEAWMVPIGGSLVSQELLARTLAARSPEAGRAAAVGGGVAYLLAGAIPVGLGLIGFTLLPGLENPEQVLPELARERLHPVFYVVFAGALISAILSTVDSALLVAGSLLSRNVLGGEGSSDRVRLRRARGGVFVFGLVAWVIALRAEGVADLVEQASGFGSAGMLVVLLMGLFTSSGSARAALTSLVAGFSTWIVVRYVLDEFAFRYLFTLGVSAGAYAIVWALERTHRDASAP